LAPGAGIGAGVVGAVAVLPGAGTSAGALVPAADGKAGVAAGGTVAAGAVLGTATLWAAAVPAETVKTRPEAVAMPSSKARRDDETREYFIDVILDQTRGGAIRPTI
jgi:hypothetical protein